MAMLSVAAIAVGSPGNPSSPEHSERTAGGESMTITKGSIGDFVGEEVLPIGDSVWLSRTGFNVSLVVAKGSDTLVAFHNDQSDRTIAKFEDWDPRDFMQRSMEAGGPVLPECGEDHHLCHCNVSPQETCTGGSLNSYKCCPDGHFCACQVVTHPDDDCVWGLQAGCVDAGAQPGDPDPQPQ